MTNDAALLFILPAVLAGLLWIMVKIIYRNDHKTDAAPPLTHDKPK